MPTPILATKLYIPLPRPKIVPRPRLIERLNEGLGSGCRLILISASAGFGKTSLVSEWVSGSKQGVAWLSLDDGDKDPARFLAYLVAALQTVMGNIGAGVLGALQSPQPPSFESLLTNLVNEIAVIPDHFILVLDDYHAVDSKPVDQVLTFLLERLPPQAHLVIATREDPPLPLARLRARGQLTELRADDLRFTPAEATDFLNQSMGLNLSAEDTAALETRTEGWIAGLQLAALSMQGHPDAASFIKSFTGSHHFVLDYLVEEVLEHQPESVQIFLLRTSILDRLCGPLCDALMLTLSPSGQKILEYLDHANLFIVPLDSDRTWYRYHHLFAELLRIRRAQAASTSAVYGGIGVVDDHIRASQWFEDNGLVMEAFQHAAAANDIERAEYLIDAGEMPLNMRGGVTAILDWLSSLPEATLDARPSLRVKSATMSLVNGQTTGVEEKLQAAEAALAGAELDDKTRSLLGQIAAARATLAVTRYQVEDMIVQAHRALEFLPPGDLTFRFTAVWTLAFAYLLQGDRAASRQACMEGIAISQKSGDIFSAILATSNLGEVQELENQLYQAADTYRRVLQLIGEHPQPNACEVHLGLARICYEWNNLEDAERHGRQSLQLAQQYDSVIDRFVISELFLAHLKLAQGNLSEAAAILSQAGQSVLQQNFMHRMPEVAAEQIWQLLHQGNLAAAAHLAEIHDLPFSKARVLLAQGDTSAALVVLEPLSQQAEARGWQDERLKVMVLLAVALRAQGQQDRALHVLGDALALAESGGFIRLFVDEGRPMARLLSEAADRGIMPDYISKLLAAFSNVAYEAGQTTNLSSVTIHPSSLVEPLSQRELEVLRLIAQGLSNRAISERLFLALDTIKGHTRRIYDKLQVQSRMEAVARARGLGLL